MNVARSGHGCVTCNGKIYVVGEHKLFCTYMGRHIPNAHASLNKAWSMLDQKVDATVQKNSIRWKCMIRSLTNGR